MILSFSCTVKPEESHFDYSLSIYIGSKHQMQKKSNFRQHFDAENSTIDWCETSTCVSGLQRVSLGSIFSHRSTQEQAV